MHNKLSTAAVVRHHCATVHPKNNGVNLIFSSSVTFFVLAIFTSDAKEKFSFTIGHRSVTNFLTWKGMAAATDLVALRCKVLGTT